MQESKVYAGDRTPVKPGGIATGTTGGQRMECRIHTRQGTLRVAGTVAEVLGWMRAQCCQCGSHPGGKMVELSEVTQ